MNKAHIYANRISPKRDRTTGHSWPHHFAYFFLILSLLLTGVMTLPAQDMSKKYENDDKLLCAAGGTRDGDTFCDYFQEYKNNKIGNPTVAAAARDNMLYILKREVDNYYNDYKVGKAKKTKWFQTVLDILGIGLAFSGTIVNGVRPKTVIAATTGSFLAGRDSINERFNLLQRKILTNKMDANRLEKWAEIVVEMRKNVADFSWDNARDQLQQYTLRGTFENALDSLVDETGSEVVVAEKALNDLKTKAGILLPPTPDDYKAAMSLDSSLTPIETAADDASTANAKAAGEVATAQTKIDEADAKKITAMGEIAVAEGKIAEAEIELKKPIKPTKKVDWAAKKAQAEKDKAQAEKDRDQAEKDKTQAGLDKEKATQDMNDTAKIWLTQRDRAKKIYTAAKADPEVSKLVALIPVRFADIAASIATHQSNIDGPNPTVEDYLFFLQKLNSIALEDIKTNSDAINRIKNIIEASK